ncbi:MAG: hypothetical protein BGN92_12950 [Sphingobacteriales bacterium 41-5]|nr:MAG: hypothetical protein BGN92_12950 [Sphingobacteriales bacterium 41-5]
MQNDKFFTDYWKGQILNDFENSFFFLVEDKENEIPYFSWQDKNGNIVDENYKGKIYKVPKTYPYRRAAKTDKEFEEVFNRAFEKSNTNDRNLFKSELLNLIDGMIKDHDTGFTPKQRLDFVSSKETYLNFNRWLTDYEPTEHNQSLSGIVAFELNRVADRFLNNDLDAAIKETIKYYQDNSYRATKKIKTSKGANAVAGAYYQIHVRTRGAQGLSKDLNYLEFIKSLFFDHENKTNEQLIKAMQRN